MPKLALVRPAAVGLVASALCVGTFSGAALAGPGAVAIPAVASEAADDRDGALIRVDHGKWKRHHRHKHRHHHGHHHGGGDGVVIIERERYVPVYREHVETYHYHYVEPRRPYLLDPLSGGIFFIFSFDGSRH